MTDKRLVKIKRNKGLQMQSEKNEPFYYRVRIKNLKFDLEEEVTELLFRYEASGSAEVLSFQQGDLNFEPDVSLSRTKSLDVFFNSIPKLDFFSELKEIAPDVEHQTFEEPHQDWLKEWKKGFKAFCLTGPFWVVPSWEREGFANAQKDLAETTKKRALKEKALIPLYIDPGMAFGTGTHATTQLCGALVFRGIQDFIKQKGFGPEVLDVGTGTAILALLASYAGAKNLMGIDVDPEAIRVARDNVEQNLVANVEISSFELSEIGRKFDMVIANIIDGVLLKLKADLLSKAQHDLILSGILLERESLFLDEFLIDAPFKIHRRLEKDEWVAFWLKRVDG